MATGASLVAAMGERLAKEQTAEASSDFAAGNSKCIGLDHLKTIVKHTAAQDLDLDCARLPL